MHYILRHRLTLFPAIFLIVVLMPSVCQSLPIASGSSVSALDVKLPVVTPAMIAYSHTRYVLHFVWAAYMMACYWGIMESGLSARLRDLSQRATGYWLARLFIYLVLLTLVLLMVTLPLGYYSGFWLEHAYHLSHQGLITWLSNRVKSSIIGIVLMTLEFSVIFWIVRSSRNWGLWLWAVSVPMVIAGFFLEPLVIDPCYNKFTLLPPGVLHQKIDALADKAGIAGASVFVVDKSKDTSKINAYVTGIGSSARIVIWDNTIKLLPSDQALCVVAHEIGHYVLMHLYIGLMATVALLSVVAIFCQRFAESWIRRLPPAWGVMGLADPAIIPVIHLACVLLWIPAAPVYNFISRIEEHQADAYALNLTGDRLAMARSFVSISEQNLSEPNPPFWIKVCLFSHPSLKERIDFALGRKS